MLLLWLVTKGLIKFQNSLIAVKSFSHEYTSTLWNEWRYLKKDFLVGYETETILILIQNIHKNDSKAFGPWCFKQNELRYRFTKFKKTVS